MSSRGISVFVCLMLAIADVWFHPISGESRQHSISNTASQEKPLQGAAAIQQLKTDGSYTSLAEAMAAAARSGAPSEVSRKNDGSVSSSSKTTGLPSPSGNRSTRA